MNNTKRSFLTSLVSLVLCLSMFLGTTFAWFTDEVTSANNIIKTGKLDISMEWSDDNQNWHKTEGLGAKPVFDYKKWEPGYTEVRYIKVENLGSLAFKYQMAINPTGMAGPLAEVIDVSYDIVTDNGSFVAPTATDKQGSLKKVSTLAELINGNGIVAGGVLLPEGESAQGYYSGEIVVCISFHMQESAGNEYQGKRIGSEFGINLYATQFDYENDSFDNSYDADATWPEIPSAGNNASADVPTDANGVVTTETTITGNGMSAVVPAGVQLAPGTSKLTLSVANKDKSDANVTIEENEELRALDVHINNVAEGNTTPIAVTLTEALPKALNIGNYTLHHVEDGVTTAMTALADGAIPAHNNFTYDPTTGDVTLYLASFSEVALVAEPAQWEGGFDYTWYTDDAKAAKSYKIANADQLAAFGAIVGGMDGQERNSFNGETITLISDINIGDLDSENSLVFYPIGYNSDDGKYEKTGVAINSSLKTFEGTFDGNGHTVSNFYHNTWEMKGDHNWYDATLQYYRDGMGLFGRVYKGTVKNLTVRNFSSDGEIATTGVIAAYADGATFENIAIFDCNPRVYNIGNGGIVGCVGWYAKEANLKTTFTNITVDNSNKISALWGSYDVACGGIVGQYYPTSGQTSASTPPNAGIDFVNCHVSAIMDVYNDVCGNYMYYQYRYAGMIIGSIRENTTNSDGKTIPDMTGISATGCTVNYGDWNDYYYCEFEKNGHPSYAGPDDYKFSRVPHSELNFTDSNGNGVVDANERASVTGCKHNHSDKENNRAIFLPFYQLFTGYGWGVSSIGLKEYSGIVTNLDITEGDQQKSVVKFESSVTELANNKEYKLGDIFNFVNNGVDLMPEAIVVGITNLDENNPVSATIVYDRENWENSTITLTGTGKVKITIQDYYFCTPTEIIVDVKNAEDVTLTDRFAVAFPNPNDLNRVGNGNSVKLGQLFTAIEGIGNNVTVTFETIYGATVDKTTVSATKSNWSAQEVKFSGTGIIKVTISDDNFSKPLTQTLEVVDATNVTGLSGTLTSNVVLLNDCELSSLIVSGRNTVYGNGFTATYTGDGRYLNNGLKQGVITVSDNGTLDNLRVVASIYPYMAFSYSDVQATAPKEVDGTKTRYYYQLSAISASGNATVSNCYVYGGRCNIFIGSGDVTIKDTILECGVAANAQIISSNEYTVTFENVTTIQKHVSPTVGTDTEKQNNKMFGAGILLGELDKDQTYTSPKIVLNGDFKQYNWATKDDSTKIKHDYSGYSKTLITEALNQADFKRTINGSEAVNMGIVFLNSTNPNIENNTGLNYTGPLEVSIATLTGKVYSLSKDAPESQVYSDHTNADRTTVNGLYVPQFKYDSTLGGQKVDEGGDEHFYREGDAIKVLFPSGDTKEIDLAALVNIAKYTGQNLGLVITVKDSSGNAVPVTNGKVSLSAADEYTVTYTVTDTLFYDKDGKQVSDTKNYSWNVTISVSLKDTAIPDAYFEFDASEQKMGFYNPGYGSNVRQFIPFLSGLKIYDYDGQKAYLRFDGNDGINKIASVERINKSNGNNALIRITLTDGGLIELELLARANSSGGSTYTGECKVKNNILYFVTDSKTAIKDETTTTAYWYIEYYKFTGNNGVEIKSARQTFTSTGSSESTPSTNFNPSINYTVTYDANEGNCVQTIGYATSAATAVTLPSATRSGYTFKGWFTAASGGTKVGGAGESYTPSANITLYAQWGAPVTLTFDANGGNCNVTEVTTGSGYTLPQATRDGYTFKGWFDSAEGGKRIGLAGETYSPDADITLYAQWIEIIIVTYDKNGGSCDTASATYIGDALTLPKATTTQTGYEFAGWYTAASGGTKIGDAGASYTPTASITLYAQWKKTAYTITYDKTEVSSSNGPATAYYGDTVTITVKYNKGEESAPTVKGTSGSTVTVTSVGSGVDYTYTFTMPAENVTVTLTGESCITPDTLITLADGTQVRVDSLKGDEMLLVWNMETGKLDKAPIMFVDSEAEAEFEVIKLYFSDGTEVKVIGEHGFWDYDLNKYVYLDRYADKYIGHTFAKQNGDRLEKVTLVDVVIEREVTTAWSPVTVGHLCYFVNGMLSMPGGVGGLFNIFEVDPETMTYDYEQLEKDIETYGLYTYEELNAICPLTEEMFNAAGGAYLKISIGKGNLTIDELINMINRYSKFI